MAGTSVTADRTSTPSRPSAEDDDRAPGGGRKLYGRRRSHKLRQGQAALLETLLPQLAAPGVAPGADIDPKSLFPTGPERIVLEIGFGGGEHLAGLAEAQPETGFFGCEHYVDGVAKLLATIDRRALRNIRLHAHDACDLIEALAPGSLDRVYLLYPDPWPKTRHVKRRFLREENLDLLARAMAPGAELRVASDIDDYIKTSLIAVRRHPDFEWMATRADDWRKPWDGWIRTRYEQKALREGRTPTYLRIRRR
ncbi:MAG: tRNA (guanine(46)-N(7))-methyltransferase TrmB [Pseudomonadota bacterium]